MKREKTVSVFILSVLKSLMKLMKLKSHDEQNNYLAGLITILPVQNRRPRLGEGAAKRDSSFS